MHNHPRSSPLAVALILLGLGALGQGCTNDYAKYYHDMTSGQGVVDNPGVIPNLGTPQVFYGTDFQSDDVKYLERGYLPIGYSDFYGESTNASGALEEAKRRKADFVVLYSHETDSGIEFGAKYWVKAKPRVFGAVCVTLPQDRKRELQRQHGVLVFAVVRGTPAFDADLHRGDVITRIGTDEVADVRTYKQLIDKHAGQHVPIEFVRAGETHETTVAFLPKPY
jgi:hypothetical protein